MQSTIQHKKQDTEIIKAVIKLQLIVAIIAMLAIEFNIPLAIKSALYGSMVAVINSSFLYWRMLKVNRSTDAPAEESLKALYWSAIERFILIGGLLAVGMLGVLKLSPLIVLVSFIIGQLVFLLGVIFIRTGRNKIKQS
ncbi:MAG: ATP synthase subunit I [Sulfuriferula sp.]|nr:ATP synthase subunit I [Sulfuriferula sp.]